MDGHAEWKHTCAVKAGISMGKLANFMTKARSWSLAHFLTPAATEAAAAAGRRQEPPRPRRPFSLLPHSCVHQDPFVHYKPPSPACAGQGDGPSEGRAQFMAHMRHWQRHWQRIYRRVPWRACVTERNGQRRCWGFGYKGRGHPTRERERCGDEDEESRLDL